MSLRDTICALASGTTPSAIAIIRVSGPKSHEIAESLLDSGCPEPRRAVLANLTDGTNRKIDEGLALYMPGPGSYTGEDTLELYLHGGRAVVEDALDTLTAIQGVRLAEAGEFTRRAFEAGKLDLTQAEGVADLIEAETQGQKSQALRQLGGSLRTLYDGWRAELTSILALLEVSIDFPDEHEAPDDTNSPVMKRIDALCRLLEAAMSDGGAGERIRDGFRVVIMGAPNAGKSTLLNYFAKRDAAIVTDIPGTTRDIVEVSLVLAGHIVWLADTAGLRETADPVESEGVRRAYAAGDVADIRIILIDGSAEDRSVDMSHTRENDLIVVNKADIGINHCDAHHYTVSAKTGDGMAALETDLAQRIAEKAAAAGNPAITRARHRDGILRALASLQDARTQILSGSGAEFAALDIRLAARALASLIGEVDVEHVLGAVFSEFCIGK